MLNNKILEVIIAISRKTSSKGISNSMRDQIFLGTLEAIFWNFLEFFGNLLRICWKFFGYSLKILWKFFENSIGILLKFYWNSFGIL